MKQFCMNRRFWKGIRKVIPQKISIRRPRKSAKKIIRALFYILRTGIPWKALPPMFHVSPSTVHRRFQEWVQDQTFFNFWKKILQKYQVKNHAMMQWLAIDGSVSKAPLGGESVGPSPVDRKKTGTKKHICIDQNDVILGITVSGANRHDNVFLKNIIRSMPIILAHNHIVFAADTAYDAKNTRTFLKKSGFIPLISKNRRRSKQKME